MKPSKSVQRFMALVTMGICISFPAQIYFLYAHQMSELQSVFMKLTWLNWLTMAALFAMSISLWRGDKKYYQVATIATILVIANNYWVAKLGDDFAPAQVHIGSLLFAIWAYGPYFVSILFGRRVEARYDFNKFVSVVVPGHELLQIPAFDISKSGIFLRIEDKDYFGLKLGAKVEMLWRNSEDQVFERSATVIRIAEPSGKYPKGLGFKFTEALAHEVD